MTPVASISTITASLAGCALSAESLLTSTLSRITTANPALNAFLQVFSDYPLALARTLDARPAPDPALAFPLAGVPIAVKDNICLDHGRTTCASRILEHYESPFTATAAARLIAAGAIPVGKTNMDEFAMGSSTELSAFGPTRNPHDHARVPGGSSGGSAAAVAAGLVPLALGSDTGGSVRQPAAFCGCVGLKPTYGRVSRYGLVAYASSLDQIGVLASTVDDAALALSIIAGPDARDATCSHRPAPAYVPDAARTPGLRRPCDEGPGRAPDDSDRSSRTRTGPSSGSAPHPTPLTLGLPRGLLSHPGLHPAVRDALAAAVAAFTAGGARILEIDLPHAPHAIAAYYLVACAEASSNLARFDGVRYGRRAVLEPTDSLADLYTRSRSEGFGPEVQRRIMLGTYALSSGYYDQYYARAMRARRLIKLDYDRAFDPAAHGLANPACDAILTPTTPTPAFKLGEKLTDPLALYLEDVFTVAVNLAGLPAISIPWSLADVDGARLPIGLQLIAPAFDEQRLVTIGRLMESLRPAAAHG